MPPLRTVFFGTAPLACPSLISLRESSLFDVAAVVTQPDRPKGRELKLQASPVKVEAINRQIPVLQPERARNPEFVEELARFRPEIIIVAAYGQILPATILDLPKFGCLNVHASLLPRYRGAAPIQWAILDDQPTTGVTIMKMDAGLDTGDILTQQQIPIDSSDNAQTLHDKLARIGAELLICTIPEYVAGRISPSTQPETGVTYARKITKEDGRLDWSLPARAVWNRVRAFTPWPGAFTFLPKETKQPLIKIWEAQVAQAGSGRPGEILKADRTGIVVACGEGTLGILNLQREGGRRLNVQQFLAGCPLKAGDQLGCAN